MLKKLISTLRMVGAPFLEYRGRNRLPLRLRHRDNTAKLIAFITGIATKIRVWRGWLSAATSWEQQREREREREIDLETEHFGDGGK